MDRQDALLAITNEIITHVTREPLFQAIAEALQRVIPLDRTAIFLHDPARDVLRLYVLTASFPSSYFRVGLEMPSRETSAPIAIASTPWLVSSSTMRSAASGLEL